MLFFSVDGSTSARAWECEPSTSTSTMLLLLCFLYEVKLNSSFFLMLSVLQSCVMFFDASNSHACVLLADSNFLILHRFWLFPAFLSLYDWHFTIFLQSIKERNIIRLISIFHCWDFYSCFFRQHRRAKEISGWKMWKSHYKLRQSCLQPLSQVLLSSCWARKFPTHYDEWRRPWEPERSAAKLLHRCCALVWLRHTSCLCFIREKTMLGEREREKER